MPDPYLEIRGGPGHPDPEIRWEGGRSPIFFFGPLFGLELRGAVPPGPSPESATGEEGWGSNSGGCPLKSFEKARAFLTERLPGIEQKNPLILFFIIMAVIKLLIKSFQT